MKKIIWLVHPLAFKEEQCEFPAYIAGLMNAEITVVFLDAGIYEHIPLYSNSPVFPTMEYKVGDIRVNEEKKQLADENRSLIRSYFTERNMNMVLHTNEGMNYDELVENSRFADILLTDISLSGINNDSGQLSPFVKKMLSRAQCPVLVLPDDKQTIEEIAFTYNGSYSSVYAIRQFTYLFENLKDAPVTVIYVEEDETHSEIPHKKMMTDFLSRHYSNYSFKTLKGNAESELMIELMYQKNTIVTFGAFGRNRLSRILHRSDAEKVMETLNIPVFITHP